MPIVSPGPRLILKLAATARAYGEGIGRFFGQVDNSRGSKRGLTRPRQKLRQRHTITPSRSLPSKLIEISPGGTSREQDRTDFGKRFSRRQRPTIGRSTAGDRAAHQQPRRGASFSADLSPE